MLEEGGFTAEDRAQINTIWPEGIGQLDSELVENNLYYMKSRLFENMSFVSFSDQQILGLLLQMHVMFFF